MSFNSIQFLYFFIAVGGMYFLIPHKARWIMLLIASYYFYMSWEPSYAILIGITTIVSYISATKIHKSSEQKNKTKHLVLCLLINFGILFIFKYFNFFADSLGEMLQIFKIEYQSPALKLLLPIGISFYTFQTVGYVIDVYRGNTPPAKHIGKFALFVSFFPQLVAGPIEKASHLLPQFEKKITFKYDRVVNGLQLMLWGFFKKVVIADRLASLVEVVYDKPENFTGMALILATILFSFQIYYDFSGYCNIAIGGAKVLGFELSDNFNRPYFSKSIREFWQRWHITLYRWFKDYIYIPLGGNRRARSRVMLNVLVVFAITGLWHGAAWTFVIWGMLHGFYIVTEILLSRKKENNKLLNGRIKPFINIIKILITFTLVTFAWIFFRSNSISDAIYIIGNLFTDIETTIDFITNKAFAAKYLRDIDLSSLELKIAIIFIVLTTVIEIFQGKTTQFSNFLRKRTTIIRWAIPLILTWSILFFGFYGYTEFIYFQF